MPSKYFGNLCIVVGVFICLGGSCAFLLGFFTGGAEALGGMITVAVGIGLIVFGAKVKKSVD